LGGAKGENTALTNHRQLEKKPLDGPGRKHGPEHFSGTKKKRKKRPETRSENRVTV